MLLSNGTRESGLVWRKETPSKFPAYADPQWTVYRQLGLRRYFSILSTTVMCTYGERRMQGIPFQQITYEGDDLLIMGGDFIVRNDGKVMFAFQQKMPNERPTVEELLSSL